MRRLALIATCLVAAAGWLVASVAGADDSHTYEVEFDYAFGLTEGSDVRVAGVNVGSVTDLEISPEKRAIITIETSGPGGELGRETTCTAEPQSLIAEYFVDCAPEGAPLGDGGRIPVEQTAQTVQPDLVQNTLREPYRMRLQLLLNEFGTGLAGNAENLNDAIRRGAPALAELRSALEILSDQNQRLSDLAADGDVVLSRVNERRGDVVRFVSEARDTAAAGADRRADLSRDVDLLDDFLARLRPAVAELGDAAGESTPLLSDLRAAAPGLSRFARIFPAFADASGTALDHLGEASVVGRRAVSEGRDEIAQLRRAGLNLPGAAEPLADFLRDLYDPRRIVEIDTRAARTCDDPSRPCWGTGRRAPTGYTAVEGLLNYAYYLASATSQFDQVGHLLHFSIFDQGLDPCASFSTGRDPETGEPGVPAKDGGTTTTTELVETHRCVSWLGPNQPGINEDLNLPPYHPSVCPEGTEPEAAKALCNAKAESGEGGNRGAARAPATGRDLPREGALPRGAPSPAELPRDFGRSLGDLPGLDDLLELPERDPGELLGPGPRRSSDQAIRDLLEFIFGR